MSYGSEKRDQIDCENQEMIDCENQEMIDRENQEMTDREYHQLEREDPDVLLSAQDRAGDRRQPGDYERWETRLDDLCWQTYDCSIKDMPDALWHDYFDDEYSPREALNEAARYW